MTSDMYLIFIALHIFVLWPLMFCKSKRKRKLRRTGKSCESVYGDASMVKTAVPTHRNFKKISTTHSKIVPPKQLQKKPEEKETKKENTNTEEKKNDQKTKQTTAETEKEKATSGKADPKPTPMAITSQKESKPKVADMPKKNPKELSIEKTQEATEISIKGTQLTNTIINDAGGLSEKTQTATEQEEIS